MSRIEEIRNNVVAGKSKLTVELVEKALVDGDKADKILSVMIDAMGDVGAKFSKGEIYVPEMMVAAKAMQKGVNVLKPYLSGESSRSLGKCIIGTVAGDLHDIGKNLVAMMIGAAGFDMIDLGVDVPVEKFIETIAENPDVKLVACSALLTSTMPSLENTVKAIKASGLSGFKIIVGGAPVTQQFADRIGADGYTVDAGAAAIKAKELAG